MAAGTLPASGGSLDFSALPAGIYVLLIDSGKGQAPLAFPIICSIRIPFKNLARM
jgi:hypothetical protein